MRGALLALLLVTPLLAQDPTSPASPKPVAGERVVAELFPATTLAYAECARPTALADALAALTKDTPWADALRAIHDQLDKSPNEDSDGAARDVAPLTLLTSSEALAELRRTRGAAAGLLGYSEKHEPRYAAAVLTGDSHAAALAFRLFLTTGARLRRTATVEGVPVFQHRGVSRIPDDGQPPAAPVGAKVVDAKAPQPWPPGDAEWTYALAPGLFVVASDVEAVRDVLVRYRGEAKTPSLLTVESFRAAQGVARADSVAFAYVTPARWLARHDAAVQGKPGGAADLVAALRFVGGVKELPLVTARLVMTGDRLEAVLDARYESRPALAALFRGPPTTPGAVGLVRRPGQSDWTATLPTGDPDGKPLLALLDAAARAGGQLGRKPSEVVADLDRATKTTAHRELMGAVRGCSLADASRSPVFVFHLDASPAAARWPRELAALLPKLLGPGVSVSSEIVGAARVYSVRVGGKDEGENYVVAATATAIYVGTDPKAVEALLLTKAPKLGASPAAGNVDLSSALTRLLPKPPPNVARAGGVVSVDGLGINGLGGLGANDGQLQQLLQVGPDGMVDNPFPNANLLARLRSLPPLTLDSGAEGNRLRLTLALPEAKAALTSLFAAPKLPPIGARPETGKEEAGKESDAPVAPRRPPG